MIRAFKVVYGLLTLNFLLPALYYALDAEGAAAMFYGLGAPFGVETQPFSEDSMFWRILGIGNVATLGFCCALLWKDLVRNYPVLVPLVFLKSMSVIGFVMAMATHPHPAFAVGIAFDGLTVWAMIFFARGAYQELTG